MPKRHRTKTTAKRDSPSTHDVSDPNIQPVVVTPQVDPVKEQQRLEKAAKRRYKLAAQTIQQKDLSAFLVTETDPEDENVNEPLDLTTQKNNSTPAPTPKEPTSSRKPASTPVAASPDPSTSKSKNGGASKPATTSATSDKDVNYSPEELPPIPDLNSSPDTQEVVIGTAIVYDDMDTKTLRKDIKKLRSSMNATSKRFYEAHRECVRIRDAYYAKCIQHEQMAKNIHIRETLRIQGRIQRPFNQMQSNMLYSSKLRSGKKIKSEPTAADKHKEEQYLFKDTSYELMRQLSHNAGNSEHDSKRHQKKNVCMLQVFNERCAMCGKYFQTKEGLKSHLAKHTKTFYRCKFCPKPYRQFASEKAFRHHLHWHALGEKLYPCDNIDPVAGQCDKKFEWPRQLESHLLTHQPPSKRCRVHNNCDAIYTFEHERKKHEEKGHALRIYRCDPCKMKFKDSFNRDVHLIKRHGSRSFGNADPPASHVIQTSKSGSARALTATATQSIPPQPSSTEDEEQRVQSPPPKKRRKRNNNSSLDTSTSQTAGHSSGSEYVPSNHETQHAYDSDFLPDIA